MLLADARTGLEALTEGLAGYRVEDSYTERHRTLLADWNEVVDGAYHLGHQPLPAQTEILGALNETIGRDATRGAGGRVDAR